MGTGRVAVISDVHGNLTAVEAVLADVAARGADLVVNLGDVAGKGPRGSAAVDRCREASDVTVRGNWDDFLPTVDDSVPALAWWREELRADQRDWLATLPLSHEMRLGGRLVRFFHASARSPHHRVHHDHTEADFDEMFAATAMTGPTEPADLVVYGDIHDAYVKTSDGRTLVNAGSVGNALDEPMPCYLLMEGDLDRTSPGTLGLQLVRVPYDVEAEIAVAHALSMPTTAQWERELRTARYRGRP
jgi:putative phosphoesterase